MFIMDRDIFTPNHFILRIMGFCPDQNDRFPNYCRLKGFFFCVSYLSLSIFMIHSITKLSSDPVAMSQCIAKGVVCVMACVKCIPFFFYRHRVFSMMKDVNKRLEDRKTWEEQKILEVWSARKSRNAKILIISYYSAVIIFALTPLFQKERMFPTFGYHHASLFTSPWYEIIYMTEIVLNFNVISGLLVCDLIGVFFVYYLGYEMDCIALWMKRIGTRDDHLQEAIARYENAYGFGKSLCNLFSIIFYIEAVVSTAALCMTGTILLKVTNPIFVSKTILSLIAITAHQCMNCFLGEMVTTANLKVGAAIQQSAWYQLSNKKDLNSLLFVIMKDQKPLRLVVGVKCVVNLKTLGDSIVLACSYMMVLKSLIYGDRTS